MVDINQEKLIGWRLDVDKVEKPCMLDIDREKPCLVDSQHWLLDFSRSTAASAFHHAL